MSKFRVEKTGATPFMQLFPFKISANVPLEHALYAQSQVFQFYMTEEPSYIIF